MRPCCGPPTICIASSSSPNRPGRNWRGTFGERQRMDMVFTVGQYTQVSMLLNSFGVQLDQGQVLDPDLKGF